MPKKNILAQKMKELKRYEQAAADRRDRRSVGTSILTGKRNATVKFCHVLHVAHKYELHKLTMTRILSEASGLF